MATAHVADLDRRLGQIDTAIETAAKRGKTNTALSAIESQRKACMALAGERNEAAGTLAALQVEHASVAAKDRQFETEAAPIRYVAELIGADTDSEPEIRWLIALMVLCCDPLAIALTAAVSARESTTARNHVWSAVPFGTCGTDPIEVSQQLWARSGTHRYSPPLARGWHTRERKCTTS